MDTIFGTVNFRNEVIWKRTTAHSSASKYAPIHDSILYYVKTAKATWKEPRLPYTDEYLNHYYKYNDGDGRLYWRADLCAAGIRKGSSGQPWRGFDPSAKGMHWKFTVERLEELDAEGRIYWPSGGSGWPQYKRYRKELKGVAVSDLWDDISRINPVGGERLGYPTQKPLALLERIIQSSSSEGDVVLDPFCGCGTAVVAAEKLKCQWISIDITHLAVALMKNRLKTMFNIDAGQDYDVVGEPKDMGSARALWEDDPFQFQFWAVSLLEAQPQEQQKRGPDRGIDGLLYFIDGPNRVPQKVVIQVKGGRVSSPQIRDLRGVVEREKSAMGLFISLEETTRDMRIEAASGGVFRSDLWQRDFPKIQIRTVAELLGGHQFELPPRQPMYQPAKRVRHTEGHQATLDDFISA